MSHMFQIVQGDLFEQKVQCLVNPWNMNFLPWFLLWPHGVSGRLKKLAGYKPFNELLRAGIIKPGSAVMTSSGRLPQKIIHVAGLKWYWVSSLEIVELCTRNALLLAQKEGLQSIAFPLIGTGVGGLDAQQVIKVMREVAEERNWSIEIIVVQLAQ